MNIHILTFIDVANCQNQDYSAEVQNVIESVPSHPKFDALTSFFSCEAQ